MSDDVELDALLQRLAQVLLEQDKKIAVAESCTGGWIAKLITDMPGSSRYFDCAFVTYSDQAKQTMLGVDAKTLAEQGAVSNAVVREMVASVLTYSSADVALAVSGVAGPDGGSLEKPVGTVYIAWNINDVTTTQHYQFNGDRDAVRKQAVVVALQGMLNGLQ